jgi:tetratricopeptide (TPR) repeat protein
MLGNWNTHAALLAIILLPTIILKALTKKVPTLVLSMQTILLGLFAFAISLTLSRGVLIIFACAILFSVILAWRKQLFFKQGVIFLSALVLAYILQSFLTADSVISRININSASRGLFIIFACAILLSVIIAWRKKPYFKQGAIVLIILVAGYILQIFLASESVIPGLNVNTELTPSSITALGSGRHLLWQPAWQMFLDRPFLGWGLGVFYLIYPQYKAPLTNESGFFAHNDYLQVLVELGPIGLILLTIFVFIITKRLWQLVFSPGVFSEYKIEAFALLVTCVGLLAHTFFTFHLYQLTIQIIFGFYLGRAAKILHTEYAIPTVSISPVIAERFKSIYIGGCVLVVLSSGVLGLAYYNLNKATEVSDLGQSLKFYRKAGEFFPSLNRYEFFSAVDLVKQLNETKSLKKRNEIKKLALQRIDMAIEKMAVDAKNYALKAEVLRITQGDFRETSAAYEQALKLNPGMLRLRYDYAKYLLAYRQYPKALAILWAGWDRLNIGAYQNGIAFLSFHLAVNQKIGKPQDNALIAQEIQRLLALKRSSSQGLYVLQQSSP